MAHLNAYSEGNHCLSRNHGDRRCMFLFKLSQCALFQLEFVSAAYYLWQHMHCKIITRSNHCISHSFTCANIKWMIVYVQTSRKKDVFQSAPYWSSILGHTVSVCIYRFLFSLLISPSLLNANWLGLLQESHSWPIGPGFFHLDHPTSCAFRLRKGNRGKHAKILLFACFLQENIKSSPDKEYMYITVQKSSDTLHFFIFC